MIPPPGAVELELPWGPTANMHWRHVMIRGSPRVLLSEEGRAYRQTVGLLLMQAGRPKLFGRLAVIYDAYPPDRRRRDIGNLEKPLTDALMHAGLFDDDEQIDDLHIRRRPMHPGGRIIVRAWRIE